MQSENQRTFDNLSDDEKIHRLMLVAQKYLSWLDVPDPVDGLIKDCTEYWDEMSETKRNYTNGD